MPSTFLILYGADNEFFLCEAEDKDGAIAIFQDEDIEGEINQVFRCEEV